MDLKPIADKLQADGLATQGKDLFINGMPVSVNQGVLLREPLTGSQIDYELPGYYKTRFQVVVRSKNYPDGKALMENIMTSLTLKNTSLGNMQVNYLRPRHEPVSYPIDNGNYQELSVNFDANYVIVA